jgi:hypothetical protein
MTRRRFEATTLWIHFYHTNVKLQPNGHGYSTFILSYTTAQKYLRKSINILLTYENPNPMHFKLSVYPEFWPFEFVENPLACLLTFY